MSTWFKNLTVYTLTPGWTMTAAEVEEKLSRHPLLPVNAASMSSQGWVRPAPGATLVYSQGKQLLIALGTEQRMLPGSVVNQVLKEKAAALEQQQGFAPGRKQLRDLKDLVIEELRPRAFIRNRTVRAWIDFEHGYLVVDSSSPKMAEDLGTVFRADVGDLPAVPLDTKQAPSAAMTGWLATGSSPPMFQVQDDCELLADNPTKAAVRYVRHSLDGPELKSLIGGGKVVTRVGMAWRERLSLVLTDKLAIKRVRFIDISEDDAATKKNDEDAFDVDFTLMTGELSLLIADLTEALGGAKPAN
ncbi:recombination-associated protein RdgC [Nevskia sp.]|uniref:recombination-associated protein RdgC n=1 Tax=Nevskia sp. TaxID=1929292 RepID=UPI0025FB4F4B|nr:recombination-associated protein RdgC [Nevskia sp.]